MGCTGRWNRNTQKMHEAPALPCIAAWEGGFPVSHGQQSQVMSPASQNRRNWCFLPTLELPQARGSATVLLCMVSHASAAQLLALGTRHLAPQLSRAWLRALQVLPASRGSQEGGTGQVAATSSRLHELPRKSLPTLRNLQGRSGGQCWGKGGPLGCGPHRPTGAAGRPLSLGAGGKQHLRGRRTCCPG